MDNVSITPGVGATVAADEIAGALHQRVKITVGADGTNDGDVSSANPLPVDLGANNDVTVTGTVTANLSATDNAVLDQIELNQDAQTALLTAMDADTSSIATDASTIAGDTTSIDGKITACNTGAVTVAASALPTGASTETTLAALNTKVTACNTGAIEGTVTANLSATDNAVLDTIDAVLDTIKTDTAALVVDAAASEALLTTIDADTGAMVTDLAAIEVLLGTIDADTGAIKTAVETLDNAISGTEMQVDVVAPLPAGTNAIGKLAANSGVDIGDVDVLSLPALAAGTNNIGDVDVVSMASGKTILRAVISAASSGDNTLVAAVADKKIKVLSVCLVAAAAVTVRFESGASGTALSGVISLDAKSGFILNAPADPNMHWFETGVNTLLNLELGGAVQVSGMMTYYTEA